jgi:hypothetical protein
MVWAVSLFTMDLITHCVSPMLELSGIRSLHRFGKAGEAPLAETVLYPQKLYMRRYLNSFRGEPAITEFD